MVLLKNASGQHFIVMSTLHYLLPFHMVFLSNISVNYKLTYFISLILSNLSTLVYLGDICKDLRLKRQEVVDFFSPLTFGVKKCFEVVL